MCDSGLLTGVLSDVFVRSEALHPVECTTTIPLPSTHRLFHVGSVERQDCGHHSTTTIPLASLHTRVQVGDSAVVITG